MGIEKERLEQLLAGRDPVQRCRRADFSTGACAI
jgi:hypothetical protein